MFGRLTYLFNLIGMTGAVNVFCRKDRVYMHDGKEQLITILENGVDYKPGQY